MFKESTVWQDEFIQFIFFFFSDRWDGWRQKRAKEIGWVKPGLGLQTEFKGKEEREPSDGRWVCARINRSEAVKRSEVTRAVHEWPRRAEGDRRGPGLVMTMSVGSGGEGNAPLEKRTEGRVCNTEIHQSFVRSFPFFLETMKDLCLIDHFGSWSIG